MFSVRVMRLLLLLVLLVCFSKRIKWRITFVCSLLTRLWGVGGSVGGDVGCCAVALRNIYVNVSVDAFVSVYSTVLCVFSV